MITEALLEQLALGQASGELEIIVDGTPLAPLRRGTSRMSSSVSTLGRRGTSARNDGQPLAGRTTPAWLSQCELCQRPEAASTVIREAWRRQQRNKRWGRW